MNCLRNSSDKDLNTKILLFPSSTHLHTARKSDYSDFNFSESRWDSQDRSDRPVGPVLVCWRLAATSRAAQDAGAGHWPQEEGCAEITGRKGGKTATRHTERPVGNDVDFYSHPQIDKKTWHSWIIRTGSYRKEILWKHKTEKHWPSFSVPFIPPLPAGNHRGEEHANRLFQKSLMDRV